MTPADKRFYARLAAVAAALLVVLVAVRLLFVRPDGRRAEPPPDTGNVVSWKDAANHYGQFRVVEGTIIRTHNSGKACFLNFHPDWKQHFTAVIFAQNFPRFPEKPEDHYLGRLVRVSGVVREYQGKPEIVLEQPNQIEVLE